MTRAHGEHDIQVGIVNRLRRDFDCIVVAVPNGGRRGKLEAIALKEMGVEAGHPDLAVYGRDARSFLIEVKEEIQAGERDVPMEDRFRSLSPSQKRLVPILRNRGFTVVVVDSVEEAVRAAVAFGLGPRLSPAPEPATEF